MLTGTELINELVDELNELKLSTWRQGFSLPLFLFISDLLTNPDYCDSIDYRNSLRRIRYERKAF